MSTFGETNEPSPPPNSSQTVLERLVAAGINETTAFQHLAAGLVHVDGVQVLDAGVAAGRPAVVVLREPS